MAKMRVYELAKELGVDSKYLLMKLKEQGEFVRSASSPIEPPVVKKLRQSLSSDPPLRPDTRPGGNNPYARQEWAARSRDADHRRQPLGDPPRRRPAASRGGRPSPELDEAARIFGVNASELKPVRRGHDNARPVDPWLLAWIDPAEKREWLNAGLTEADLALVKQCRQIGMTPEDLRVALPHGDTPLRRLRQGESVTHVRHRIDEARGQAG